MTTASSASAKKLTQLSSPATISVSVVPAARKLGRRPIFVRFVGLRSNLLRGSRLQCSDNACCLFTYKLAVKYGIVFYLGVISVLNGGCLGG